MDSQISLQQPILDGGIRSINFFNGRLLSARDLTREQSANREAERRLGRAIGEGIAYGYETGRLASSVLDRALVTGDGSVLQDYERALMLVGGEAELDGVPLEPFALYVLAPGHSARLSSSSEARVMLMGGGAFSTPRHVYWNFVSSSRERINQAKEDWKAMRFPLIPGDDEEFIPLPAVPTTVSYP